LIISLCPGLRLAEPFERLTSALADRYRIERELGAGGMATVYLARDLRHDREVAIKVLRPELAATVGPQRFLQEIQIAARLTHPHILPLHDSGQADGFLYYVMPYVEGESLRDKLSREGELPVTETVRVLKEVTDALAYAHGRGVVHRDIKPENVMLSGRHALVTDFGVAKALHEATGRQQLTTAGVALGTPAYMAPEQAAADPHMDHRADVYAVGAMGYELLTGRPPFTGSSPQMVLAAHVTEVPRPVTDHRPAVPPVMATTIMRCLEKKPADRWQTAAELLAQLEVLASTPSGGMTPTATQPFTAVVAAPMSRRRKTIWLAAGGLVVLVLAVVGWLAFLRAPAIDPDLVVVAPFENQTGDASLDRLGLEMAERLSLVLAREGLGKPVAAARVRELVGASGRGSPELARRIARRAGAGLLVSGAYGGTKARLELRAELLRMPGGRQVSVVEPVISASDGLATDSLGERLAVAVAANHDWGDDYGWGRDHRLPRNLAAYRALVAGDGYWAKGDGPRAAESYRKALELDPGWPSAAIQLGWAISSDSIAKILERQSATLLPGDRDAVQYFAAWLRQDVEAAYRAAAARLRVDSATWAGPGVFTAYYTNRLHESVALGARRHLRSYWTDPERASSWLHYNMAAALHGLGKHQEELELAVETRREFPENQLDAITLELQARAGLGQVAELERLVAEAEGMRPSTQRASAYSVSRSAIAAQELLAHGYSDAANRVVERGTRWFKQQLDQDPDSPALLSGYGDLLLNSNQRLEEYLGVAQRLIARKAEFYHVDGLEKAGSAAAKLGQRALALDYSRQLSAAGAAPGETAFSRAVISASLGDTLAAMDHFRAAFEAGYWAARAYHTRHRSVFHFILRKYPAYVELTRPRD
jgi:protein kinase-like protein